MAVCPRRVWMSFFPIWIRYEPYLLLLYGWDKGFFLLLLLLVPVRDLMGFRIYQRMGFGNGERNGDGSRTMEMETLATETEREEREGAWGRRLASTGIMSSSNNIHAYILHASKNIHIHRWKERGCVHLRRSGPLNWYFKERERCTL